MDAKAITHLCESPFHPRRSDSRPGSRQSAYLIVIRGGMPGTMLLLGDEEMTLGRSAENSFSLDDMTVSRLHATVRMDATGAITLTDQASTNGTFLNGSPLQAGRAVRLEDGDRVQLGSGVVLKLVRLDSSDVHFQQEMFERTVRDGLTGVYNRSYFLNRLGPLVARSYSQGIGLAILMVDVDHFKSINDRFGHLVGDVVLREVASLLKESTRNDDLVARYGGEEFIVALPFSSADLATERAEQIRLGVGAKPIPFIGGTARVTVSIGLAYGSSEWPLKPLALIEAADESLYQAKARGRNRVILGQTRPQPLPKETQSVELLTSL